MTDIGAGLCMDGWTPLQIESTLATVTLGAILRGRPKYPLYMAKQAAQLPRHIRQTLKAWLVEDKRRPVPEPDFDLDDAEKLLMDTGSPEQAEALYLAIPDADLATELGNAATRCIKFLQDHLTHRDEPTIMGPRPTRPTRQEIAEFERLWAVVTDPLSVLAELSAGSLSSDEVDALSTTWPALYNEMRAAVVEGLAYVGAANPKWEPGHRQQTQIGILMGTESGVDLGLGVQLQDLYEAEKNKPQRQAARRGGASKVSDELTPAQRLQR